MMRWNFDDVFARLWDHILVQAYGTSDLSSLKHLPEDPEGHAFFLAVEAAFASNTTRIKDAVPVDRELVMYMAGWGRDTTRGQLQRGGPIGHRHNHFIRRALKAFLQTLRDAIKYGYLRYDSDRALYGCFTVPQWMIDTFMAEAQDQAEHINTMWDKHPSVRHYIRTDPTFLQ